MKIHNHLLPVRATFTLLAVLQVFLCGQIAAQTVSLESSMITSSRVFMQNPDFSLNPAPDLMKRKVVFKKLARLTPAFHEWHSEYKVQSWSRYTDNVLRPKLTLDFPDHVMDITSQGNWQNIKQRHFAEPIPALFSTSNLKVSSLQSTWVSADRHWEVSAIITDPADERLFNNLSDLSSMGANRLRQAPSRHLWLGVHWKF